MFKSKYILSIMMIMLVLTSYAKELTYKYKLHDKYKALCTVKEDIYINDKYQATSEILNKISVEITDAKEKDGEHTAKYYITENVYQGAKNEKPIYSIKDDNIYLSKFRQNYLGIMSEDEDDYMPVLRNLPTFPNKDLKVNEEWSAPAYEVHDFNKLAGIKEPYVIPINVYYKYVGEETFQNNKYDKIEATYSIFFRPNIQTMRAPNVPVRITGESVMVILWDNVAGRIAASYEKFDFIYQFADKTTYEFVGEAEAVITKIEKLDSDNALKNIEKDLVNNNDIAVEKRRDGIALIMNDIKFKSDTDLLLPGEDKKIEKISKILKNYPNNDIKVIGHTALSGTVKDQDELSLLRAAKVAKMIVDFGSKTNTEIMIEGKGARVPVATNSTSAGMAKNRRVEVLILEE